MNNIALTPQSQIYSDINLSLLHAQQFNYSDKKFLGCILVEEMNGRHCFKSRNTISEETGITIRTQSRIISKLKAYGFLKARQRGKNQSNVYILSSIWKTNLFKPFIQTCIDAYEGAVTKVGPLRISKVEYYKIINVFSNKERPVEKLVQLFLAKRDRAPRFFDNLFTGFTSNSKLPRPKTSFLSGKQLERGYKEWMFNSNPHVPPAPLDQGKPLDGIVYIRQDEIDPEINLNQLWDSYERRSREDARRTRIIEENRVMRLEAAQRRARAFRPSPEEIEAIRKRLSSKILARC